jgi:hypothetical protein
MAKAPMFPQRVRVVNSLKFTRLVEDVAVLHTHLGEIRVPLAWWLAHKDDPSLIVVITAVEAEPRHEGAKLAEETKG